MKLLLSSLLLGSLWAISCRNDVIQTPDVSVTEGEDLNITCCITHASKRLKFIWKKNQTEMQTQSHFLNNQSQESKMNYSCSSLTFLNITREDSGRYICNVHMEIPSHVKSVGNGTVIKVVPRVSADPDGPVDLPAKIPIILVSVVVGLLLLIIIGCYCTLRIRHAQAARVIYEVPHIDSEEADMDKHSDSSSRGSSQWRQVPVYESFDYFEGVRAKESG